MPQTPEPQTRPYRILALDGGGYRGLLSVEVLKHLCTAIGSEAWLGQIDLFAGTSAGALTAAGLASGLPIDRIRQIYIEGGPKIFKHGPSALINMVRNLIRPRHGLENLATEIDRAFPKHPALGDLPRKVLLAAFDASGARSTKKSRSARWRAKFFHNLQAVPGGPVNDDVQVLLRDALLASCAAPVYFPDHNMYLDGGVVATNPCMVALAQTQDNRYFNDSNLPRSARKGDMPPPDPGDRMAPVLPHGVQVLSIGTGTLPQYLRTRPNWGFAQWIWPLAKPPQPLLSLMMTGDTEMATYQARQLLGNNFRRAQIDFAPDDDIDLDRPERQGDLERYALEYANGQGTSPDADAFADIAAWIRTW